MTKSPAQIFHELTGLELPDNFHADDILRRMKEFLGKEEFGNFLLTVNYNQDLWVISLDYILNPSSLLEKALEYIEQRKGE